MSNSIEAAKERMRARYAQLNNRSGNNGPKVGWWRAKDTPSLNPEDGNTIRIIPPPYIDCADGRNDPWIATQVVKLPVVGERYPTRDFVSPSLYGLPDPIADWKAELERGGPEERKFAKTLFPRDIYLALIVDLDDLEAGVQIWKFGNMVMKQLVKFASSNHYNLPWDIEQGHDIQVAKAGEGYETAYELFLVPRPSPLIRASEWLAQAAKIDLARYVNVETAETLLEVIDTKRYDYEIAKKRRIERDNTQGRPVPLFIVRDKEDEDDDEGGSVRSSGEAGAAAARQTAPEPPPAAAAGGGRRDEPETPAASSDTLMGKRVTFSADGERWTGKVIGEFIENGVNYVKVDTEDGGEPWEVKTEKVVVVVEEPAPARRRRRSDEPEPAPQVEAPATAAEPADDTAASIMSRIRGMHGRKAQQ